MSIAEPRTAWGSTEHDPAGSAIGRVAIVVVHHFYRPDVPASASVAAERKAMRDVQAYHVQKGWDDVGYNFVVFDSGRVYEGRGWGRSGAHAKGANRRSVGVCFAIDGDADDATPAAWAAARELIREGVKLGHIEPDYRVDGHREWQPKSCPGNLVFPHLDARLGPQAADAPAPQSAPQPAEPTKEAAEVTYLHAQASGDNPEVVIPLPPTGRPKVLYLATDPEPAYIRLAIGDDDGWRVEPSGPEDEWPDYYVRLPDGTAALEVARGRTWKRAIPAGVEMVAVRHYGGPPVGFTVEVS